MALSPSARNETQDVQRTRSAIDQVTREAQLIVRRVETDAFQQLLELLEAALYIADGVGGHDCVTPSGVTSAR